VTEFKLELDVPESWIASLRAIHDGTGATTSPVSQIADQIEAQLPVKEPRAFGSVVRASVADAVGRVLLVRTLEDARPIKEWCLGIARYEWSDLRNPEVVRDGLGEPS
jgi:hypothetical protein